MLKKISVSDLTIGMYIEKLDGNWLKHPFWKTSFELQSNKDLKTLKSSDVTHVWIDTAKGKDINTKKEPVSAPDTKAQEAPAVKKTFVQVALSQEMKHAKKVLSKAKQATMDMFQEARMGNAISTKEVAPLIDEINESIARNPSAMLSITRIKNKDEYTYLHSVAVCALMIALGKQLNYDGDFHALGMAGLLHDVGKMAIPDEILNKPGKLTAEEFELVKSHPKRGWEILKATDESVSDVALDVCLHHHERIDGDGYPEQLSGKQLSLVAKMGAICDVYDAITSNRSYKDGWDPAMSLKKMAQWKDGHFDNDIFNAFIKTVGIYPAGTLVKLKSGRLGIVTDQSEKTLLQPKIKVFFSSASNSPIPTKIVDLSRSQETIDSIENPESWNFSRQQIMDIIST